MPALEISDSELECFKKKTKMTEARFWGLFPSFFLGFKICGDLSGEFLLFIFFFSAFVCLFFFF